MNPLCSLAGWVRVRYISADISSVLGELEKMQITVFDVSAADELTVEFFVAHRQMDAICAAAERRGEKLQTVGRMGLFWPLRSVLRRPLLLLGVVLLVIVAVALPGRILFVSTEGNGSVAANRIQEAAAEAGLGFWSDRRSIRSEQVKNKLLDAIPELGWAGVNTYGCKAVITVRERDDGEQEQSTWPIRHIVASRDGIIKSCTVTEGCGVCFVGQAVKEGEILISGYTDCGTVIWATAAKGQIFASTRRNLTVLTPKMRHIRTDANEKKVRFSVTFGKKRINFYKGSGISGSGCVKMYSEYVLRLPGGFELPVTLRKEYSSEHDCVLSDVVDPDAILVSFASEYMNTQMVSGTVTEKRETFTEANGFRMLAGEYACTEEIGIIQDEKIGDFHGKADGTDRKRGSGG